MLICCATATSAQQYVLKVSPRKRKAERDVEYDVALSFAGEDRSYVEKVAAYLHAIGIKVFYDRYEQSALWGKDLYQHLDDVYRRKAKYCIVFASKHYAKKLWTKHELRSAQARAFSSNQEYVLPCRFDDTEIPGITATTGYVDLRNTTPQQLGNLVAEKLGSDYRVPEMIDYLRSYLRDYVIEQDGEDLTFDCESEDYYGGRFPVRLLLEMYKMDMLEYMFLLPAIVPH